MMEDSGNSCNPAPGTETEIVVALQDFSKSDGKPWETHLRKGDLMKLLDSTDKDWWKVQIDNRKGFVPAEYLMKVNLTTSLPVVNTDTPMDTSESNILQIEETPNIDRLPDRKLHEGTAGSSGYTTSAPVGAKKRLGKLSSIDSSSVDALTEVQHCNQREEPTNDRKKSRKIASSSDIVKAQAMPADQSNIFSSNLEIHTSEVTFISPMEQVLTHEELLGKILEYFSNDIYQLKCVRLVNCLWKNCAYSAFRRNPNLLPTIVPNDFYGSKASKSKPSNKNCCWTLEKWLKNCNSSKLTNFLKKVKPGSGLPLKIVINEFTQETTSFLRNYAGEINHIVIIFTKLGCLNDQAEVVSLPALEHACFIGNQLFSSDASLSKIYLMWKTLIGEGEHLKSYIEHLEYMYENPVNDFSHLSYFENIIASRKLPKLRKLTLGGSTLNPQVNQIPVVLMKRDKLTELTLAGCHEFQLGPMKSLKVLNLRNGATLRGVDRQSQLLPSLEKVTVRGLFMDSYIYDKPLRMDHHLTKLFRKSQNLYNSHYLNNMPVIESVKVMDIAQKSENKTDQQLTKVVACFPKLTKLWWTSDQNMSELISGSRNIFTKLDHLNILVFQFKGGTFVDLLNLLTGTLPDNIPKEQEHWHSFLDDKRDTVRNLKKLTSLTIGICYDLHLPPVEGKFLFQAAFNRMEALKKIIFGIVRFGSYAERKAERLRNWKRSDQTVSMLSKSDLLEITKPDFYEDSPSLGIDDIFVRILDDM